MAEQSSTITTFRALVMLVCLALIPLAAIGGTSFPAVVKAIQDGRLPTLADFRAGSGTSHANLGVAPRFEPQRTPAVAAIAPAGNGGNLRSQQPTQPLLGGSQQNSSGESAVIAASYNAPITAQTAAISDQSTSFPQSRVSQNDNSNDRAHPGLSPLPASADGLRSVAVNGADPYNVGVPQRAAAGSAQPPQQDHLASDTLFKQIQDRLKLLGATYYLLEAWGDHADEFRFYCRMSIGGNRHVTKSFEQVDADPLSAMTRVLQQVEEWQKGGQAVPTALTTGTAPDLR